MVAPQEVRWVARLVPLATGTVDALLHAPIDLDVWERHDDYLVVAASEASLSELERRRLAEVERLSTVEDYVADARKYERSDEGGNSE